METALPRTILSPIALASRDQVLKVISANRLERVEQVCHELLEVNTRDMSPDEPGVRACVAAVIEGVLAALGSSRTRVLESAMHAVARFAAQREGVDALTVATIIKDAASVIEVAESDPDLEVAIRAALAVCDQLLGPDRDKVIAFLGVALADTSRPKESELKTPTDSP